jgi:hypothetical protein
MGSFGKLFSAHDKRRKRTVGAVLGFLLVLLLLWLFPGRTDDRAARLLQLLEDYRSELEFPGRSVAEAARNLATARNAYDFVTRDVVLVPYLDRRQTPDQVMITRFANPLDRAVLLGELLGEMKWDVRYLVLDPLEDSPMALGRPPRRDSPALLALKRFLSEEVELAPEMLEIAQEAASSKAADALRAEIAAGVATTLDTLGNIENGPGLSWVDDPDQNSASQPWLLRRYIVVAERDGERRIFDPVYAERDLTNDPDLAGLQDTPFDQIEWEFFSYTFDMPDVAPVNIRLGMVDGTGLEQTLIEWRGNPAVDEVELRFLPAIAPLDKLRDGTRPDQIDHWQPYLRVNGRQITGKPFSLSFAGATSTIDRQPPFATPDGLEPADPALVSSMQVESVDATNWPIVRLAVSLEGSGSGLWLPDHFLVRDQGRAYPLWLLSLAQDSRPLLVLTDVSWSMGENGGFEASQRAILSLLEVIPDGQNVGLATFAGSPDGRVPVEPLADRVAFAESVRGMEMDSYTGILKALDWAAGQETLAGGVVVLLSDGEDNVGGDEAAIIDRLKQAGIQVFSVPLGEGADAGLLQRVAEQTGGKFSYQNDARALEALFQRIGTEISSLVQLQYRIADQAPGPGGGAPAQNTVPGSDIAAGGKRRISVSLRGTDLGARADYTPPASPVQRTPPHLYLDVTTRAGDFGGEYTRARRVLLRLDRPDAALRLIGTWSLIGDLGSYPEQTYLIAYLSRWIDALRLLGVMTPPEADEMRASGETTPRPLDEWLADDERRWPGLARMRMVNAYRALSRIETERGIVYPAPGPALYLHRAEFAADTETEGAVERGETFDVLLRPARPVHGGEMNLDTVAGEIAASIAEGRIVGGRDGVSTLLEVAPDLQALGLADLRSDTSGRFPPGFADAVEPGWDASWLVAAEQRPQALWQIDGSYSNYWRNHFRTFLLDEDGFAKGGSLREIAQQFEKIDSLLGLYGAVYGNFAGLTSFASAELSALIAFKKTENKMWCYSTLMLAQVGQAIESEDALLNRDVDAARQQAASLCGVQGGPGSAENGDIFRDAARDAAREWAKSYGVNKLKDAIGDPASTGMSLWEVGRALRDVAQAFGYEGFAGVSAASSAAPYETPGFLFSPTMELAIADIVSGVK